MSQNTVQNYFIQVDTEGLVALNNPSSDQTLSFVSIFGPGASSSGQSVRYFVIDLIQNEDINITLIPKDLTTTARIFFNSPNKTAPFKVGGKEGSKYFQGNFHHYAVTMHLTAKQLLEDLTDLTLNIAVVPVGRNVDEGIAFSIDPKLQINHPPSP